MAHLLSCAPPSRNKVDLPDAHGKLASNQSFLILQTPQGSTMSTIILYMSISEDGFIADKYGESDWLDSFNLNKYGFEEFYKKIDALIMGKKTYEELIEKGPWPHTTKPTFVFTDSEEEPIAPNVVFGGGDVKTFVEMLEKKTNYKQIWLVGGANVAQEFYDAECIDEYIITTLPVELDEGTEMPESILYHEKMTRIDEREYDDGVMQEHYESI
jgi:dihydrofolate reductase